MQNNINLTDAEVTGRAVVNLGTGATLTCAHVVHQVASIKWYKHNEVIPIQNKAEFAFAAVAFTDTSKYYCQVEFSNFGTYKSSVFDFFIQGLLMK